MTANQLVNLDKQGKSDYINKIKQGARGRGTSSHYSRKGQNMAKRDHKEADIPPMRQKNVQPSFYYSNKYEIMSMKEFVLILEESKRKK